MGSVIHARVRRQLSRVATAVLLTSDYYLVGYYSSNADPAKRRRTIEVKVKRLARSSGTGRRTR